MKNKWIESFLKIPEMEQLYNEYLMEPTHVKKINIEEHFKRHVKKLKIISYFSKVLYYEAQRFDKKKRKNSDLNLLIIDKEELNMDKLFYSDQHYNEQNDLNNHSKRVENLIEDKKLYKIISDLSNKNKELLYLLYVREMDESTISKQLGITKQAVNKSKNIILKKIRKQYFNDDLGGI